MDQESPPNTIARRGTKCATKPIPSRPRAALVFLSAHRRRTRPVRGGVRPGQWGWLGCADQAMLRTVGSDLARPSEGMIKQVQLHGWKSFLDATLHIDSLTVLIGTNASGKSNALDALLFLKRAASGVPLTSALRGDQSLPAVRGGLEWAALDKKGRFEVAALVQGAEQRTDYV